MEFAVRSADCVYHISHEFTMTTWVFTLEEFEFASIFIEKLFNVHRGSFVCTGSYLQSSS